MPDYELLSPGLVARMKREKADGTYTDFSFDESTAIRRYPSTRVKPALLRSTFVQDTDKILYCPFYNRYTDKTQVFPLYRNDDISRRGLHVQLVSRIARTIGAALNLNLNLIEAISLGHDIGHPPFAHSGEKYLDELWFKHCGKHFLHNIHSVRVLDGIFQYNMSLQTLIGIACHNGELAYDELHPSTLDNFEDFDALIKSCIEDKSNVSKLIPSTLEGCVVRFADIIAYIGKDRQDAGRAGFLSESAFEKTPIGSINAELINNLEINIIENSYGMPYIKMDRKHFDAMIAVVRENYKKIYHPATAAAGLDENIKPMMADLYDRFLDDLKRGDRSSPVYTHHIDYINRSYYRRRSPYEESDPDQIVVDFIASMTDDFFIDTYNRLFPGHKYSINYKGYYDV